MDVKSLAKSKRAHSQHHSKKSHANHHNQKLKAPPSSSSPPSNDAIVGTAKKPLGKQVKEKSHRLQGSSGLPSNWDRYEEELEFGSEGVSPRDAATKTADVVLPKSKGADFRYLVSEAQSQANTSSEGFPSLNDVLPGEFNVGLSSMLAVRGEGILSWIGDDNFVVEDKTSGTHGASFLSLNLQALAENLEKVDLSKRLFIESDLLPPELCVEGSAAGRDEEPDKMHSTEGSELANRMSEELNLDDFAADFKTANQSTSSNSSGNSHVASTFTMSDNSLIPLDDVNAEFQQVGNSDGNKAFNPSTEANLHYTQDTRGKLSTFEAAAAEEELDMLLGSFSETKILDSPGPSSNISLPVSPGITSVDPPQTSNKEPVSSKTASIAASLNDALDNLLEETSTLMNPNVPLRPQEEKSVVRSMQASSHSGSKSKVLDDFDSWLDTI